MYRLLLTSFFLTISYFGVSQNNALVYHKIIRGLPTEFQMLHDSSGYVVSYSYSANADNPYNDFGVFNDTLISVLTDDLSEPYVLVVYNASFQLQSVILYYHPSYLQILPISMEEILLNFNTYSLAQFVSSPPIEDFPAPNFGQSILLSYNAFSPALTGVLNFSPPFFPVSQIVSIRDYIKATYGETPPLPDNKTAVAIGDSAVVTYLNLFQNQFLNDTDEFTSWGGNQNAVRVKYNLQTNAFTSEQIGSSTGHLATFFMAPAKNGSSLFRVGLVRGNDTPISSSGEEIEMAPNDSLYHVFVTKETASGQTEWLTELYAYNNTFADTNMTNGNQFKVNNDIYSIVNKNENVYISSRYRARSNFGDSLLYRSFNGEESLLSQSIPNYGSGANIFKFTHSESRVHKIDSYGNAVGKLSCVNTMVSHENGSNLSGKPQVNYLFEVGDKLAWVHAYYAINDTAAEFTFTGADGSTQVTSFDFPAGQGSIILWLDTDLNILDHWLIPYQNAEIGGIVIHSIMPYQGDTLLIHGHINRHTTSTLNPFAETSPIMVNDWSSFFAFYSAPEILTSAKTAKKPSSFSVYPNPATQTLRVNGLNATHDYCIYDLSGRALQKGRVSQNEQIHVSNLTSGMYILQIDIDGSGSTEKFVVE